MSETRKIRAGNGALTLEIENGALSAVTLPKEVPADFDQQDLTIIAEELSRHKVLLDRATPFTRKVWERMRKIPRGKTMTYSELAAAIGKPKAVRAVGSAVGRNRLLILLPCHRVVAKNGLGGFRAGLDWKRKLLELESAR